MATQKIQPRYLVLADYYRYLIRSGQLKPGAQLPSVSQFRREHGMSYCAQYTAKLILKAEGLIEAQPGLGVYVVDRTDGAA